MSRRRRTHKREMIPDPKYGSVVVSKFMNCMMREGRKSVSAKIFYDALAEAAEKAGAEPLELFDTALKNVTPSAEVRSRRVGGATYQIPVEVRPERGRALAISWLIHAARARSEQSMSARLRSEFLDASNNRGGAVRKREDAHRMAEANRAFSHYRW